MFSGIRVQLKRLQRARRDERGATAVEFAIVAGPFFMMVAGLIELGMIFLVTVSLENSTDILARTIRTGEMQAAGGSTAASFKNTICTNMGWLQSDCQTNLRINVTTYQSFSGTNNQKAPISNGQWSNNTQNFNCGGPGDIVLVQAFYPWTLFAPGFNYALQKLNGGQTVISATTVFRNEPYAGAPGC